MTIMNRLKLRNNILQNGSNGNRKKYSKQFNYCVSLLRRIKRASTSIFLRKILLIRKVFENSYLIFFRKILSLEIITSIEIDKVVSNYCETTNIRE